jgi:hypothetical protein
MKASLNRHVKKMLKAVASMEEKEFNEQRNSVLT